MRTAACLVLWLALGVVPAWAQDSTGISSYPASFFADARPATANDMIGRLPGFAMDGGDGSRGFAGSGGNVLVNGQRPTAKTDGLGDILTRIPAANVARIDVIRGGAPGIDMQNHSVVANVILKADAANQLILTTGVTWTEAGQWHPNLGAEYHGQSGAITYEASAAITTNGWQDSDGNGFRLVTAPGGAPARDHASSWGLIRMGYSLHGAVSMPLWGGDWSNNLTLTRAGVGSGIEYDSAVSASRFDTIDHQRNGELGSHWQGMLGKVSLEAVLLERLAHEENDQTSATPSGRSVFRSLTDSGESIGRVTLRTALSPALEVEGGGEVARNFLNGKSRYAVGGAAVTLPNANVSVAELRGEGFTTATWKIDPAMILEAGIRAEFSDISETGDSHKAREFFYPKPRLVFSWQMNEATQLRLRAERVLGQLNFNDFVASSNLAGFGVAGGNASIRPDQRWQYEAAAERHFGDKGDLVLTALHEEIKDLRDYVPIGGGLDAPGNIAHATSDRLALGGTAPLDWLGLKIGLFKPDFFWLTSGMVDPVTGEHRRMSDQRNINSYYTITQDLEEWKSTWRLFWGTGWSNTDWRISQVLRTNYHNNPFVNFYWTYHPASDWTLDFGAENFASYRYEQEQYFYAGPRNVAGPPTVQDVRIRTTPRFYLNVRVTL